MLVTVIDDKGLIKSFEQVCNNELCYEGIGKAEDIIQVTKTLNAFGPPKCKDFLVIARLMTRECTSWLIVHTNSTSGREKIK